MKKSEEIKEYINKNRESIEKKEKSEIAQLLAKEFDISTASASKYYYDWKREYTKSKNCVPTAKEDKKPIEEVKERARDKIRIPTNINGIEKPKLEILTAQIKGEYGLYEITQEGVKVGDEIFKNEDELDAYRKRELNNFYATIREISEVMYMSGIAK